MGIDGSDIKKRNNERRAREEQAGQERRTEEERAAKGRDNDDQELTNVNLITCDACGRDLSRTAPACPHCGDPRTKYNNDIKKQSAKETRLGCLVLLAFLGIIILWNINSDKKPESTAVTAVTAAPHLKTAAEIRKEKIAVCLYKWDLVLQELLKKGMKNPKSYEQEPTEVSDMSDHLIMSTTYRGTNSFGGIVPNTVSAKVDINCNMIEMLSGDE
jgi:hypothetical protein